MKSLLFSPLRMRGVAFRNRVGVAPMCQYSCQDGFAHEWHLVHLGSRAVGGAGLVIVEASAVSPQARITPGDLGIWSDAHVEALRPTVSFIARQGAVPGIQLAHAGRKGSTQVPWMGKRAIPATDGGWEVKAPSAVPFNADYPMPLALTEADMVQVIEDFVAATRHSAAAGFQVLELHMGHGYLLHEFLSPLSNFRGDAYGGEFEGRVRFPLRVAAAVRAAWPDEFPLFVRLSATDWLAEGWDIEQSVEFARRLRACGVDLIDCSSGSIMPGSHGSGERNFQVPFAARIRRDASVATAAVGTVTEPQQAEDILQRQQADIVLLGRALLRDPYWPLRAAQSLGAEAAWPVQYERAVTRMGAG